MADDALPDAPATSRGHYREVFNWAPDGMLIAGPDGRIQDVNPQLLRQFGYTADELVGERVEILVPPDARKGHESYRASFVRQPRVRPMGLEMDLRGCRKDGSEFPVEVSLSPLHIGQPGFVVAVIRDTTQQERLRALSAGTLRAAENERRRIARELHDDTAQRLATVLLSLGSAARARKEDVREVLLDGVRDELVEIANGIRRIAQGLRPPELENLGVVHATRGWVLRGLQEAGIEAEFDADPVDPMLSADAKLALYRIIQEAISNVVRHSGAEMTRVRIRAGQGAVIATVEDDGDGFDIEMSRRTTNRLGLLGMHERAVMVGALLSVQSEAGKGTTIRLAIPTHESGSNA